MTAALAQISINFLALKTPNGAINRRPVCCLTHLRERKVSFQYKFRAFKGKSSFLTVKRDKNAIFVREERWGCGKRVIFAKFKDGFGFDGIGDGGGGGEDNNNNNNLRVLTNLVLSIGFAYLVLTGQLDWLLDFIVSVWLLVVVLPIVGLGAFIWWAGRDIVQGTCPNCGNDFQIFRSTINDEVQLCPFCAQPFSVVNDEFVSDPVMFSNQSTTFGQAFSDFDTRSKKGIYFAGKDSLIGVVDVEAEVKDVE